MTKEKELWKFKFENLEKLVNDNIQSLLYSNKLDTNFKNKSFSQIFNEIKCHQIDCDIKIKTLKNEVDKNKSFTLELINQMKTFRRSLKKNHSKRSLSLPKSSNIKKVRKK